MTYSDKQLNTLKKLFAKANDPGCTEDERRTFEAKVCNLMVRWDVAAEDLRSPTDTPDRIRAHTYTFVGGNAKTGIATMVNHITKTFGGACYWNSGRANGKKQARSVITIYATDKQYADIRLWIDHLYPQMYLDIKRDKPRSWMSYSNAWASAIGSRLRERFKEERDDDTNDRYAVALRSARQVMEDEGPSLGRSSVRVTNSADSARGWRGGQNANLPGKGITGSRAALPAGR